MVLGWFSTAATVAHVTSGFSGIMVYVLWFMAYVLGV